MIILLLLQLVRYNVGGKHFLVETNENKSLDGGDKLKVCKCSMLDSGI